MKNNNLEGFDIRIYQLLIKLNHSCEDTVYGLPLANDDTVRDMIKVVRDWLDEVSQDYYLG
jgi:hypothetical protein